MLELTQAQANTLRSLADSAIGITVIAASVSDDDGYMVRAAITESVAEHEALVTIGFLQDVTSEFSDSVARMVKTLDVDHLRNRQFKVYSLTGTGRTLFSDFSNFIQ